jgi:preprotein translocase subunit SecB
MTTTTKQPPPLDIQRYHVEELVFRALREYDPSQKTASAIDVDFDVQQDEASTRDYRISMRIQLAANGYTAEENAPYTVDMTIIGYFTFAEGTTEDVSQKMIYINGPAILFGIARGITGQATGASRHGQFVLPTVNFIEIEKARLEQALAESERALAEVQKQLGAQETAPASTPDSETKRAS